MTRDALKALLEAKDCTIVENRGNGVYIVETADGKQDVVVPSIPVYAGMRGKLIDPGGDLKVFIAEPTM